MNSRIIASLAAGLICAASSLSVFSAPDLSGTYNVATLTPLERPRAFGKNLYLSLEDAEKMRAADAAAKAERRAIQTEKRHRLVEMVLQEQQGTWVDITRFGSITAIKRF